MSRITRMFRDLARFSSGPRQRPLPYAAAGLCETPLPRDIFLTDDDGPTAATEVMLDILGEESVPATFFLTGEHAAGLGRRDRRSNSSSESCARAISSAITAFAIFRKADRYMPKSTAI